MAKRKLIITVAPTSNFHGKEANPALPEQPHEIAEETYRCYNAGASIVHIHARDKQGVQTNDVNVFREINTLVRAKCDIIIQNSTAPAMKPGTTADDGLQVVDAGPEMCSLDCGVVVVGYKNGEHPIMWTRSWLKKAAKLMKDRAIKPELEIFNNSQLEDVKNILVAEGLLDKPYSCSFVFNMHKVSQGASEWNPETLMYYLRRLPPDSVFTSLGVGPAQYPATVITMLMGGNVRVGFEDNIYYRHGELAKSNAQLVERIVSVAQDAGIEIASAVEARESLNIPQLRAKATSATEALACSR